MYSEHRSTLAHGAVPYWTASVGIRKTETEAQRPLLRKLHDLLTETAAAVGRV